MSVIQHDRPASARGVARADLAQLAALGEADRATLAHLIREGRGENSQRALASDYAYLDAWCVAATGEALPWPAPAGLALRFIAHHLWSSAAKADDPQHGMPLAVAEVLRASGRLRGNEPHAQRR